jgi:hypothetical protein
MIVNGSTPYSSSNRTSKLVGIDGLLGTSHFKKKGETPYRTTPSIHFVPVNQCPQVANGPLHKSDVHYNPEKSIPSDE